AKARLYLSRGLYMDGAIGQHVQLGDLPPNLKMCAAQHLQTKLLKVEIQTCICIHRCNGKSSCSVDAINSVFGDPCYGTYKYLELDYICQTQSQVISVQRAVYGRRDRTTCITGRPASQIENVRCSTPANKVAERCNGKSSCSVDAINSVFGDPCYGTYKYLEVDYTCQ
ncbi:unnamed protein product, partial [Menidia menidia]